MTQQTSYVGLDLMTAIEQTEAFLFFCQVFDHICDVWPEAVLVRDRFGVKQVYAELKKHPFSEVLKAHITKQIRGRYGVVVRMRWELSALLMMERKLLSVSATTALLDTLIYMWTVFGVPKD